MANAPSIPELKANTINAMLNIATVADMLAGEHGEQGEQERLTVAAATNIAFAARNAYAAAIALQHIRSGSVESLDSVMTRIMVELKADICTAAEAKMSDSTRRLFRESRRTEGEVINEVINGDEIINEVIDVIDDGDGPM